MSKIKTGPYRDPQRGKIAGVCAGLSDYFNMELWLVRIIYVSAVLLIGGPFFIVAYIACWFIFDVKPDEEPEFVSEYEQPVNVKRNIWQSGEPPKMALHDIEQQLNRVDLRIQQLEQYVTSSEFSLRSEINKL